MVMPCPPACIPAGIIFIGMNTSMSCRVSVAGPVCDNLVNTVCCMQDPEDAHIAAKCRILSWRKVCAAEKAAARGSAFPEAGIGEGHGLWGELDEPPPRWRQVRRRTQGPRSEQALPPPPPPPPPPVPRAASSRQAPWRGRCARHACHAYMHNPAHLGFQGHILFNLSGHGCKRSAE